VDPDDVVTEAGALLSEPRVAIALELRGNLLTDATQHMDQMLQQVPQGEPMTIQCARLVRVDFAAAGTLLNWLAANHSDGVQVQLMGVTEYASVTLSKK
jgi:ABC-type transporter Mla MlaB component